MKKYCFVLLGLVLTELIVLAQPCFTFATTLARAFQWFSIAAIAWGLVGHRAGSAFASLL